MEWSIQQISRLAGVSSRTMRHYDDEGILPPSRTGAGGMRFYDESALVRLQRILLLRSLGVGIPAIRQSLDATADEVALAEQLSWLRGERVRIDRQIRAVEGTLDARERGAEMDASAALDGFDQRQHEEEVTQRWGADAWASGQDWWSAKTSDEQRAFQEESAAIGTAFAEAHAAGLEADEPAVQAIVARHWAWIAEAWQREPEAEAYAGLGELYAADDRYSAVTGGSESVGLVRDAMLVFAASRP